MYITPKTDRQTDVYNKYIYIPLYIYVYTDSLQYDSDIYIGFVFNYA